MQRPQVNIEHFNNVYFLGIGGIGMSALARYFKLIGKQVAGYDKTPSPLTAELEQEGIEVHFDDLGPNIPQAYKNESETLVVITPAVPQNLGERLFFVHTGHTILKRAEVLGLITRQTTGLTVAGTHGKTTTSTLLAHILKDSKVGCNAFLGGISSNYSSNFISDPDSAYTVIEADEFDRSFLQLDPFASIVTTTDADHLDIYGDDDHFQDGFKSFAKLISPDGFLIRHINVALDHPHTTTYGFDLAADYAGSNIRYLDGKFLFDLKTPNNSWKDIELGVPGIHNAENAIACIAMTTKLGLNEDSIRKALVNFKGVKRRFEYHIRTEELVYIDDYAHHPTEINALVRSVKLLYPDKRIIGIFQPHLFSRTRDFFDGFAKELSVLDTCILLPIYPAREEPISGITSDALLERITCAEKRVMEPQEALHYLRDLKTDGVILTIGAGDIDRIVEPLTNLLHQA